MAKSVRNLIIKQLRFQGETLQEIGNKYGITRERVRQIVGDVKPMYKEIKYPKKLTLTEKLNKYTIKSSEENCWDWSGGKTLAGYGRVSWEGKCWYSHRVVWVVNFGEIPEGFEVYHTCDNPACVNPTHLFLGVHQENMNDRDKKGRNVIKKLRIKDVINIRKLLDGKVITVMLLAERYKVSPQAIYDIKRGITFKNLTK